MRLLVQRVLQAQITIEHKMIAHIQDGLLVYIGLHKNDSETVLDYMYNKLIHLRIFEDSEGKMNLSALDLNKEILAVSQFTLYGSTQKGYRPNFMEAMEPKKAETLYLQFVEKLKSSPLRVQEGRFGAMMQISYTNDGPISIIIEKDN